MNETIKIHVAKYNESKGWPTTEDSLVETITDSKTIWEGDADEHRWWTGVFRVVDIGGMKIGFDWAITTGDDSAREKGWEFDPSSICEVEEYEVKQISYKAKRL